MDAYRKTAAVVAHLAAAILVQKHVDIRAVAGQRLINGVVHNFIYAVMQAAKISGADVHARALAHSLKPFQNLNLRFIVNVLFHNGGAVVDICDFLMDFRGLIGHQIPLL